MGFVSGRLYADKPQSGFIGETKCDGQNARQGRQFARLGHMRIFQSQAPCFQAREQCINAPTAAINRQNFLDPDTACRDNQHLPALQTHHDDPDGRGRRFLIPAQIPNAFQDAALTFSQADRMDG